MNQRTKLPAVSILMGVFNCQAYLNKSLDSLLNQTFQDFELVVVDDASTDDTRTILQEYAQRDSRISVVRNEKNIGLGPSLNRGLGICHADLVARADGDDIYLPDRLKKTNSVHGFSSRNWCVFYGLSPDERERQIL